mgnify:CR=1 FL=1
MNSFPKFSFFIPIPLSSTIICICINFYVSTVPFIKFILCFGMNTELFLLGILVVIFFELRLLAGSDGLCVTDDSYIFCSYNTHKWIFINPFRFVNLRLFDIKLSRIYKKRLLSFKILLKIYGLDLSKCNKNSMFFDSAWNERIWKACDITSNMLK